MKQHSDGWIMTSPKFLYLFLILAFCGSTFYNHGILKTLENYPLSSEEYCNSDDENKVFWDKNDRAKSEFFRKNLKLETLIGKGDVILGFRALYKNRTVIAKIATDSDLYYSDIEMAIFRELNKAPSIPNIPQLQLAIPSMPNPFESVSYLVDNLGVDKHEAKDLVMKRRISVMVMELLGENRRPKDLEEVQRLIKSLLETMEFVHSRNIMHCDLHQWNYHWDGHRVTLFDWNGGFFYKPKVVKIHYPRTPTHLFPPEALRNESAVHSSVHAFDVYTIGRIMKEVLRLCCGIDYEMLQEKALDGRKSSWSNDDDDDDDDDDNDISTTRSAPLPRRIIDAAIAYELASYMMHEDPDKRPTTTQALQHLFFTRKIFKKRQVPKHRERYIEPETEEP